MSGNPFVFLGVGEGSSSVNGRMTTICSTHRPPRLPGDGCGCVREEASNGWVLKLCERHQVEPGIREYCLA